MITATEITTSKKELNWFLRNSKRAQCKILSDGEFLYLIDDHTPKSGKSSALIVGESDHQNGGDWGVDRQALRKALRAMKASEEVSLSIVDDKCTIHCDSLGDVDISKPKAGFTSTWLNILGKVRLEIGADDIKRMLNIASHCTDDDTRYALDGVGVFVGHNGVQAVATNGRSLGVQNLELTISDEEQERRPNGYLFPRRLIEHAASMNTELMALETQDSAFDGCLGGKMFTEGHNTRFPDYTSVLSNAIDGMELAETHGAKELTGACDKSIRMFKANGDEGLPKVHFILNGETAAFDANLVKNIVKTTGAKTIHVYLDESDPACSPGVFFGDDRPILQILMPLSA